MALNAVRLLRLSGLARRAVLAAAAALVPLSSLAQTDEDPRNWGYCPPPRPPACAGARQERPEARLACQKEVEDYVARVFRYRNCLTSESERAVREANKVLQDLKCANDGGDCQPPGYGLRR